MQLQDYLDRFRAGCKVSYKTTKDRLSKPSPKASRREFTKQVNSSANPEESPLLRLPREIRDRIWEFCVGGQVIHINNPSSEKITHIICRAPFTELTIHHLSSPSVHDTANSDNGRPWVRNRPPGQWDSESTDLTEIRRICEDRPALMDYGFRHGTCAHHAWTLSTLDLDNPRAQRTIQHEQLHLALLRVSQTIYAEAFEILWTRNSFLFAKGPTFASFVTALTAHQRHTLRHVLLKMENPIRMPYLRRGVEERAAALGPPYGSTLLYVRGLRGLPNLRTVYLSTAVDVPAEVLQRVWVLAELVVERRSKGVVRGSRGRDGPEGLGAQGAPNEPDEQPSQKRVDNRRSLEAATGVEVLAELHARPQLQRFTIHVEHLWHKDLHRRSVTHVDDEKVTRDVGVGLERWVRGEYGVGSGSGNGLGNGLGDRVGSELGSHEEEKRGEGEREGEGRIGERREAREVEGQDVVRLAHVSGSELAARLDALAVYLEMKRHDKFWRVAHPGFSGQP